MEIEKPGVALYTEKQMQVAAFLGGPLPVGILFYKNFIRLGKERSAYISLAIAFIFIVLLLTSIYYAENSIINTLPRFALPAFYSLLTYFLYRNFLYKSIQQSMQNGATQGSHWSVAGLTLAGLVATVGTVLSLALVMPELPEFEGPYTSYAKNKLYHDNSLSQKELKLVADRLYYMDYFDQDGFEAKAIENDGVIEISVFYLLANWQDREFINYFKDQALLLEGDVGQKVAFILRDYSFNGDLKTKRITY